MERIISLLETIKKECNTRRYLLTQEPEICDYYYRASKPKRDELLDLLRKGKYKEALSLVRDAEYTIRELQVIAKNNGVVNYSHMPKDQLLERLKQDGFI